MPHSHRPGGLRQSNKAHKGGGKGISKRKRRVKAGAGRVETTGAPGSIGQPEHKQQGASGSRFARANATRQNRDKKRKEMWLQRRVGGGGEVCTEGSSSLTSIIQRPPPAPPRLAVWVPLSRKADCKMLQIRLERIAEEVSVQGPVTTCFFRKLCHRVTFLNPVESADDPDGFFSILEAAKVADVLLVTLPMSDGVDSSIDEAGELLLTTLRAQGVPSLVGVLQGLNGLSKAQGKEARNWSKRFFATEFGSQAKIKVVSAESGGEEDLQRAIATCSPRPLHWRVMRTSLVAHSASVVRSEGGEEGILKVLGFVRGRPLNPNQLIHVCEVGVGRIKGIWRVEDPLPFHQKSPDRNNDTAVVVGDDYNAKKDGSPSSGVTKRTLLAMALTELQESLDMEAEPDPLQGEQTWPSKEELEEAAAAAEAEASSDGSKMADLRKPQGWSTYQAKWLLGGDDLLDEEDGVVIGDTHAATHDDWFKDDTGDAEDGDDDDDLMDETVGEGEGEDSVRRAAAAAQINQQEKETEDREFPDEVDTPIDIPAFKRFSRYRSLQNMRNAEWNPKENLPVDYGRIFQFDDFTMVQRNVLRDGEIEEKLQMQRLLEGKTKVKHGAQRNRVSEPQMASSFAAIMEVEDEDVASKRSEEEEDYGDDHMIEDEVNIPGQLSKKRNNNSNLLVYTTNGIGLVVSGAFVELELELGGGPEALSLAETRIELNSKCGLPLVAFGLLPFENKLSVLHFNIQRNPRCINPLPSKEKLIIHCGFRKWEAHPSFYQMSLNSDKHKFLRFLQPNCHTGTAVYGPVTFLPAPVLIFQDVNDTAAVGSLSSSPPYREDQQQQQHMEIDNEGHAGNQKQGKSAPTISSRRKLVATGTLQSVDPDRIILKRVILTGYPIRARKRKAVVKHMFHSPEDVEWFKPAELRTKHGLIGHIKESVGTHGLFKVVLNRYIKQNDTVMLELYKRVYPKLVEGKCKVF